MALIASGVRPEVSVADNEYGTPASTKSIVKTPFSSVNTWQTRMVTGLHGSNADELSASYMVSVTGTATAGVPSARTTRPRTDVPER